MCAKAEWASVTPFGPGARSPLSEPQGAFETGIRPEPSASLIPFHGFRARRAAGEASGIH